MVPKQPPKRTATRPGLGIEDALPRLESAELQKVRDSFAEGSRIEGSREDARDSKPEGFITPPPQSASRVPREDVEEEAPRSSRVDREIPSSPVPGSRRSPVPRANTAIGLGIKSHPSDTSHRSASKPVSRPPSSKPGQWQDEAPSGARARKALSVDSVGAAATRIARGTRPAAPKIIASQQNIASAPIDSRTAFVLSLVDGASDVGTIVDATGMPQDEVIAILARLARLGLIAVP